MFTVEHLTEDDRAVSPVIGIVLMLAITVIAATVVGTAVFTTLGDAQSDTPQANFTFNQGPNGDVTIRHSGGDPLNASGLSVKVDSSTVSAGFSGTVTAGDTGTVTGLSAGDEITVVYQSDGDTVLLGSYTVR